MKKQSKGVLQRLYALGFVLWFGLGACTPAWGQEALTVRINNIETKGASLAACVDNASAITSLQVVKGTFTENDWKTIKGAKETGGKFEKLATLEFAEGVEVASVPDYGLEGMLSLESVIFHSNTPLTIGESAFAESGLTKVVLPSRLQELRSWAFSNCKNLTKVELPPTLLQKDWDDYVVSCEGVFAGCEQLTSVVFPGFSSSIIRDGVVPREYFRDCKGVTEIQLPLSICTIKEKAFSNCTELTNITLPADISELEDGAFDGCTGLTQLACHNITPPRLRDNAFSGVDFNNCTLYVLEENIDAYKDDEG